MERCESAAELVKRLVGIGQLVITWLSQLFFGYFTDGAVRGLSLFRPIPPRSCREAGVPLKYCMCRKEVTLSVDTAEARQAGETVCNLFLY